MSSDDIDRLESTIQWTLPLDYRSALASNFANVGKVSEDVYIGSFFAALIERDGFGLLQEWELFKKRRLLPIALTMGGDRLLIDAKGRIHRWYHESSRVKKVYESFSDFASSLSPRL